MLPRPQTNSSDTLDQNTAVMDTKGIPFSKKLVIFDFDLTISSKHIHQIVAKSKLSDEAKQWDLIKEILPTGSAETWRALISDLIKEGNHVAIASFSLYPHLIKRYLKDILKILPEDLEKITIKTGMPLNNQIMHKRDHIASLKREYSIENNADVILVDDNETNCEAAAKEGCHTILATAEGTHLTSLRQLTAGELLSTPPRAADTKETQSEALIIPEETPKQVRNKIFHSLEKKAPKGATSRTSAGQPYIPFTEKETKHTSPTDDNLILEPISKTQLDEKKKFSLNLLKLTGKKALLRYRDSKKQEITLDFKTAREQKTTSDQKSEPIVKKIMFCQIENGWQVTDPNHIKQIQESLQTIEQDTMLAHKKELFSWIEKTYPTCDGVPYSDLFIPEKESVLKTRMESMCSSLQSLTIEELKAIQGQLYYIFSKEPGKHVHIADIILKINVENVVNNFSNTDTASLSEEHAELLNLWVLAINTRFPKKQLDETAEENRTLRQKLAESQKANLELQKQVLTLEQRLTSEDYEKTVIRRHLNTALQSLQHKSQKSGWHKWVALLGIILGVGLCVTGFGSFAGLPIISGSIAALITIGSVGGALILGTIAALFRSLRKGLPPSAQTNLPTTDFTERVLPGFTPDDNTTTAKLNRSLSKEAPVPTTTTDSFPEDDNSTTFEDLAFPGPSAPSWHDHATSLFSSSSSNPTTFSSSRPPAIDTTTIVEEQQNNSPTSSF